MSLVEEAVNPPIGGGMTSVVPATGDGVGEDSVMVDVSTTTEELVVVDLVAPNQSGQPKEG